jgi:hypothetical protein
VFFNLHKPITKLLGLPLSVVLDRPHGYHEPMRQIPPSRILAREMQARDMSMTDLAALSGLSCDVIAGVLLDGAVVDTAIAQGLSQAWGRR